MALKFPPVVEAWLYRDPDDIGDALLRRSDRIERGIAATAPSAPVHEARDRYYTAARRLHVKQIMKGRR